MKMNKFIEGLKILSKYFARDNYNIAVEHDMFCVYSTDLPVSLEDLKTLYALGWKQLDLDPGVENYDATETWVAHM